MIRPTRLRGCRVARNANPRVFRKVRHASDPRSLRMARKRFQDVRLMNLFRELQAATGENVAVRIAGREFASLNELVSWLAWRRNISERTLWRWDERFSERGFPGLLDAKRSDSESSRAFAGRDEAVALIMSRWFDGRTPSEIHAELKRRWRGLYRDGSKCPSYYAILALLRLKADAAAQGATSKVRP